MYRTDVYFICKTLAEAPIFLAIPFIFTVIVYPMIGLYPDVKHFFIAAAVVALVANVATSFGKIHWEMIVFFFPKNPPDPFYFSQVI